MLKRSRNLDFAYGLSVAAFALVFVGYFIGFSSTFALIYLWGLCLVIPQLWDSSFRFIAILLFPGVLLRYLLPKTLRVAVNALPSEVLPVGQNA